MKKYLIVLAIITNSFQLYSQGNKGKVMFSLNGNYNEFINESGVSTNYYVNKIKSFSTGLSVGTFGSEKFFEGIGFCYNQTRDFRVNSLYYNYYSYFDQVDIKSSSFLFKIFAGRYFQLSERLYFFINCNTYLGSINVEKNFLDIRSLKVTNTPITDPSSANYYDDRISTDQSSSDAFYFSANINPELVYFFTRKVGLYLEMGGIGYSLIDWKTDQAGWNISFDPRYWAVGFKLKL